MYEEDTTNAESGLAGKIKDNEDAALSKDLDREVLTPEGNDNDVNASVMLPRRNSHSIVKVIRSKRDSDGNAVGTSNDKHILDTREYHVTFDDGQVIKLT